MALSRWRMSVVALAAACCCLSLASFGDSALSAASPEKGTIRALTKPSGEVLLAFSRPGLVAKMLVKRGDTVKAGQVVAEEDNTEEAAAYEVAKAEGDDITRVHAQEMIRDQKEAVYNRKVDSKVANATELEEARLDWQVGIANVTLSNFEHLQAVKKANQALAALEKTKLRSPIDGVVDDTMLHEGETADSQNMKVMRVVNVDPLWVDAPVPLTEAVKIHKDDAATVRFADGTSRTGKVISVRSLADPGSTTLGVRIEVENKDKRPAGEFVEVTFGASAKMTAVNQ